jgi:hypothetical protein
MVRVDGTWTWSCVRVHAVCPRTWWCVWAAYTIVGPPPRDARVCVEHHEQPIVACARPEQRTRDVSSSTAAAVYVLWREQQRAAAQQQSSTAAQQHSSTSTSTCEAVVAQTRPCTSTCSAAAVGRQSRT